MPSRGFRVELRSEGWGFRGQDLSYWAKGVCIRRVKELHELSGMKTGRENGIQFARLLAC